MAGGRIALGLQLVFLDRFALGTLLFLVALGPVARWVYPSLLVGVVTLDARGVVFVTWLSLLAAWTAMISTRIVLEYANERFRVPLRAPSWLERNQVLLFGLTTVPLLATLLSSTDEPLPVAGLAVSAGALLALATLLVATLVRERLTDPATAPPNFLMTTDLPMIRRAREKPVPRSRVLGLLHDLARALMRRLGPGYVDEHQEPLAGHLLSLAFFACFLAVYAFGYFAFTPERGPEPVPALAFVMLVLIGGSWFLSGLAFFFDRYRVPVLTLLVAGSFAISYAFDSDYYYHRLTRADPALPAGQRVERLRSLVTTWQKKNTPIMTVIAANGGGIQAAAWTARALVEIQRQCPAFAPSVFLVSAVSGGSVGAMYFVDRYAAVGFPPDPSVLDRILEAAETSSLDEAGWGLAYPDLLRAFLPFAVYPNTIDRAWSLERAWARGLQMGGRPPSTMRDWAAGIEAGWRPIPVFNATIVETGERFLISPVDLPDGWGRVFSTIYPHDTLDVVTAARLSATFPYVTPIARRDRGRTDFHVADGGYFDNFGVATALQALRDVGPMYQALGGRKIVLVELRSAAEPSLGDPRSHRGWFFQTVGPILTLLNVRAGAQRFRNDVEVADFAAAHRAQDTFERLVFKVAKDGPLSWKLTEGDKRALRREWLAPENQQELRRLTSLLGCSS